MGHPSLDNNTDLTLSPVYVTDADGRPLLVPICKGTFRIVPVAGEDSPEPLPPCPSGEFWGAPDLSSYKYEPETAFVKPATDVVLIAHACAPRMGTSKLDVTFSLGDLSKTVRVFGDRTWVKRFGIVDMSAPEPFERIPLIYERAFGGWDSPEPDPINSSFEPRNPVGVGLKQRRFVEGLAVPNLEDPRKPLRQYGDRPPPAGFGFIGPSWEPRSQYAGTYDEKWQEQRAPLLPHDFDERFFNAASPGLIAPGYLRGDEQVRIENVSASGMIAFALPGRPSPKIRVQLRGREDAVLETRLDTVIVNVDENLLVMIWRSNLILRSGPHDVVSIELRDGAS